MDRRRFIGAAGSLALVGVAGCLHDEDGPESVVQAWYEKLADLDPDADNDAAQEELDDLLHTQSPIRGAIALFIGIVGEGEGSDQFEIESVETDIVAEDIGADRIREEFLFIQEGREQLLEELAEENAVVRATVDLSNGETETEDWLVVTEDGDWKLFA